MILRVCFYHAWVFWIFFLSGLVESVMTYPFERPICHLTHSMLGRIVLSHHQPVPTLPQGIGLAQTSSAFFFLVPGVCGLGNRYKTLTIPGVGSERYIQAMPWTIRGWSLQESNWKMTGPWLITRPEVVVWNVGSKCCVVLIFFSCRWRTHREGKPRNVMTLCRTGGCSREPIFFHHSPTPMGSSSASNQELTPYHWGTNLCFFLVTNQDGLHMTSPVLVSSQVAINLQI